MVRVRTERGIARLRIASGAVLAVTAIAGHDESLGDALLRTGDLNAKAHFEALPKRNADARPVGEWLAQEQLATRGAVEHALRAQLRGRMLALFSCREITHEIALDEDGGGVPLSAPVRIADVVLGCMRARASSAMSWTAAPAAQRALEGELSCTSRGRLILSQAVLWPEEEALAGLLSRACERIEIDRMCAAHPRAHALLFLLAALGGVAASDSPGRAAFGSSARPSTSYGLLVRKRRQIRQGDSPYRLLDLPFGAGPSDARKALRQFAGKLHPDALGPDVPDDLRRASNEVMGALIDAERKVRERVRDFR